MLCCIYYTVVIKERNYFLLLKFIYQWIKNLTLKMFPTVNCLHFWGWVGGSGGGGGEEKEQVYFMVTEMPLFRYSLIMCVFNSNK